MTTTGELRAIIEELQFIDIGDAASYLGEESVVVEESCVSDQSVASSIPNEADDLLVWANLHCNCVVL
ncbi:MAG TPA: hypothetical protein VKV20_01375 [Ktedonobacteraceae bacterium]|jgi:hypothetical protein|nr:hypothetical protein [Ktedonobacteraceae bacterium]